MTADANGVEPLPGESEAEYVARQTRLKEEAAARMRAKFGGSGGLGGRMGGVGSSSSTAPAPAPASGGGGWGGMFGSVLTGAKGLALESASGLAQLATDVGDAAGGLGRTVGAAAGGLASESVDGLKAIATDTAAVAIPSAQASTAAAASPAPVPARQPRPAASSAARGGSAIKAAKKSAAADGWGGDDDDWGESWGEDEAKTPSATEVPPASKPQTSASATKSRPAAVSSPAAPAPTPAPAPAAANANANGAPDTPSAQPAARSAVKPAATPTSPSPATPVSTMPAAASAAPTTPAADSSSVRKTTDMLRGLAGGAVSVASAVGSGAAAVGSMVAADALEGWRAAEGGGKAVVSSSTALAANVAAKTATVAANVKAGGSGGAVGATTGAVVGGLVGGAKGFALESVSGLAQLATDVGGAASVVGGGVVGAASAVGGMVAADMHGAVENIGGEKVASQIKAASENVVGVATGGAELIVSGIKDNVRVLDTVARTATERLSDEGGGGESADADADAGGGAGDFSAAPPLRSFEEYLDEQGGGAQLEALEKMRDGCAVRADLKLARLGASQRGAFNATFETLRALLASDDDDDAGGGGGGGGRAEAAEAAGAAGPPTSRLASHAVEALMAPALEGSLAELRGWTEECEKALLNTASAADGGGEASGGDSGEARAGGESGGGGGGSGKSDTAEPVAAPSDADRAARARECVSGLRGVATRALAMQCAAALRTTREYAARCMREAEAPSAVQPCAELAPAEMAHGLDWPFVSELERAVWKARALHGLQAALLSNIDALTAHCAAAAKTLRAHAAAAAAPASAAEQLRPLLKQMATALQLDAGTAISLGQEALQLSCPALQLVALGELQGA